MHHPRDRIIHTTAVVTPVVEHWLEREIAQWVLHAVWYLPFTDSPRKHTVTYHFRCHYTKSNPIDDHSNISSKKVTEADFQTIVPLYLHAVWYLPFTNSPRKHTVTYRFSDLQEVYSGNRQIHTKCQLQYLHPHQQVANVTV